MEVAAFYRFVDLDDLEALRFSLHARAADLGLKGTVLLAAEGVNGGLCGGRAQLDAWLDELRLDERFRGLPVSYSSAALGNPVFARLKVRVQPEIVSFGQPNCHPADRAGTPVDGVDWNALLDDPEVVVVDVRNRYEIAIGAFPDSLDPGTSAFREFPSFVRRALDPARDRSVALYCTGGIRCEKASAHLLNQGFENVHQLNGGILGYLANAPDSENRWQGECFVFDQRVSVDRQFRQGRHRLCPACGQPLGLGDARLAQCGQGTACPVCCD